jgi:hypothetical protein
VSSKLEKHRKIERSKEEDTMWWELENTRNKKNKIVKKNKM